MTTSLRPQVDFNQVRKEQQQANLRQRRQDELDEGEEEEDDFFEYSDSEHEEEQEEENEFIPITEKWMIFSSDHNYYDAPFRFVTWIDQTYHIASVLEKIKVEHGLPYAHAFNPNSGMIQPSGEYATPIGASFTYLQH